jgi:hypothetical protein
MIENHKWCWSRSRCRGGAVVGVVDVERHVAEEIADVREDDLVGEYVLLVGFRDENVVGSHVERSPKTLLPLSLIGSHEMWFRRLTILSYGVHRRIGWGRLRRPSALERRGRQRWLCVVFAERSDLSFIATM